MASGNMKIGIITECIQPLIIKLLNVLCFVSLSLLNLSQFEFSLLDGTVVLWLALSPHS